MRQEMLSGQPWPKLFGAAAMGGLAVYVLNLMGGRTRRALARDKMFSLAGKASHEATVAARDLKGRLRGVLAEARRVLRRSDVTNDRVLEDRVRAKLGRVVSNPHAIDVLVWQGRVTLTGPLLAKEESPLMEAVRSTPGVKNVENRLAIHERPDHISSLQGGAGRPQMKSGWMQEEWPSAMRFTAALSGGGLMLYGVGRRDGAGMAIAAIGAGLFARALMNMPVKRLIGIGEGRRAIDLQKTIAIAAAPETVFDIWSRYENFPRFMSHVQEVKDLGGGRSHWVVKGPAGGRVEWDSVLTESIPAKLLAWKSEPGSMVQHAGYVRFDETDGGTRVTVRTSYNPAGALGHTFSALLGSDLKHKMDADLMRMKTFIETGILPQDVAQQETASPS